MEVRDAAAEPPQLQPPESFRVGGRGLRLVEAHTLCVVHLAGKLDIATVLAEYLREQTITYPADLVLI